MTLLDRLTAREVSQYAMVRAKPWVEQTWFNSTLITVFQKQLGNRGIDLSLFKEMSESLGNLPASHLIGILSN